MRRIPIVEDLKDIVNIVTQSGLLQLMVDNASLLRSVEGKTLLELGLGSSRSVHSVHIDATTMEAFKLMVEKDCSAVAVLGVRNELLGVVSSRDVRLLVHSNAGPLYAALQSPLRVFIEAVNRHRINVSNPAIRCRATDTLGSVIARMSAAKIHRIFVVDDHDHLLRVVSLRDIIEMFVTEPSSDYFSNYFEQYHPTIGQ